ncbi:MAG: LTA synthase family protein [Ignavibacteria bacterium]
MKEKKDNTNLKSAFIPAHIKFLFLAFLSGMVLFTLFRLLLLWINKSQTEGIDAPVMLYALFNRGCLFDSAVNSYMLSVPFLFFTLGSFITPARKFFYWPAFIIASAFYVFAIAIHAADIPYFDYFNSRLTNGILGWSEDIGLMIKTRFSTPTYYPFIGLFLAAAFLYIFLQKKIANKTIFRKVPKREPVYARILFTLVAGFLLFLGARGEIREKLMPLGVANSFFSNFSFSNQLGLNPVYSFFASYKDKKLAYLNDEDAIKNAQNSLNINPKYESPIARDVVFDNPGLKPNVVIFLVESLSAFKLKRYGYEHNLMPFLDSLMKVSAVFDNVYTDGMHTHNGLYSSLYGMPSVLKNKAMTSPLTAGQKHSGVSNVLHENGYNSVFFCTGDRKFDNMNGFFLNNDFDEVVGFEDYPVKGETTEWGVSDRVLFDYGLKKMDTLASSGKPFLSVLLTVSTHEALKPPSDAGFKPDAVNDYDKLFQYTDWALSEFFKNAQKTDWFRNTVFVIVGDHGQNFDPTYEISLSYHHVPMIYYSPAIIKPQSYSKMGTQMDLFPTLMGFISMPYVNNTLGIDLTKESRPFSFFAADTKIGCIKEDYFLLIRSNGPESLYKYGKRDVTNYLNENTALADSMRTYVYSMLQTYSYMAVHKYLPLPRK